MAFVLSNRGKQKLSENGYVYVKNKKVPTGKKRSGTVKSICQINVKSYIVVYTKTGDATVIKRI